jgi:hypothetical protein
VGLGDVVFSRDEIMAVASQHYFFRLRTVVRIELVTGDEIWLSGGRNNRALQELRQHARWVPDDEKAAVSGP